MILQHPYREEMPRPGHGAFHPFYNLEVGEVGHRLCQQRLEGGVTETAQPAPETTFRDFKDPLGEEYKEYAGPWLAVLEPVIVPERPENARESGWVIVVQERESEALQPLQAFTRQLVSLALQSVAVVLLAVLALWGIVWLMQSDSRDRRLLRFSRRKSGLPSESAVSSAGPSSSSQASSARLHGDGARGSEDARMASASPQSRPTA
jgi:hypothetical protein